MDPRTRRLLLSLAVAMAGLLAAPSPAWAEEPDDVVVVGQADGVEAGPSQVSSVNIADLPASADLADAVARVPGVVVERLGGPGDLAQVAIRGAGARQVEVLLDGIPLNPEGGSAVDLSELPPSAFERVDVYRGAAPALLGATALGGVVALVPTSGEIARDSLGAGSFRTGRGAATLATATPVGHLLANVDGLYTRGDFRYYDDRDTRWVQTDDRVIRRENNDTGLLSGLVELGGPRWVLLYAGLVRDDGVPGFTFAPSERVRYGLARNLGGVRLSTAVGATELGLRGYAVDRVEELSDPDGEIGVGAQDDLERSTSVGVDGWAKVLLGGSARLDFGGGGRIERFGSTDRLTGAVAPIRGRAVAKGVAALSLLGRRADLVPGIVALALVDREDPGDPTVLALPRLGGVLRAKGWAIKANAGAFARPPDLTELYGDRGALIGNPDLRPERGNQVDLGPTWAGERGRIEVVGYLARYRDLIAWVVGAQGVARAENVARADVGGVELAADLAPGPILAGGNATLSLARNGSDAYAGNQLPHVPVVESWARIGVQGRWGSWTVDQDFAAGTFADTANFHPEPARFRLGTTLDLRPTRVLTVEVDVRNALGTISALGPRDPLVDDGFRVPVPVVDFVGSPLPGRSIAVTLVVTPVIDGAGGG